MDGKIFQNIAFLFVSINSNNEKTKKQAGAELCQAQHSLDPAWLSLAEQQLKLYWHKKIVRWMK